MNVIDLHCHTTASDGLLPPAELVAHAAAVGLETIAVTDHDTVSGIQPAMDAAQHFDLEVVPGVEINTDVPTGEVHILGYFLNDGWRDAELGGLLSRIEQGRIVRARTMVKRLVSLGVPLSFQDVQDMAGGEIIGRLHVAQALVKAGHVATRREAFDRYIGRHGPAYAPRFKLTPADACRAIVGAGGLPSLAHPLGDVIDDVDGLAGLEVRLAELCEAGLVGMEVYYPRHTAQMIARLLALTRRFGLVPTGGSDYHGPMPEKAELGSIYVPRRCLRKLREVEAARRPIQPGPPQK
jgi:predicted metal-dependent phosphoesterase TrpH